MRLTDLQDFVSGAIQRTRPLSEDDHLATATRAIIAASARLSPIEQLDIYREQFWLRHTAALEEDFPALARVLGGDDFHALCMNYLGEKPPDSFTLRDLGAALPTFLCASPAYANDTLAHDLAAYEWAFVEAFDAPDAPPLDTDAIARASEEQWSRARLELAPSVQLVSARHPVDELRAAVLNGESSARPPPKNTCLVVWRGADAMKYLDVEDAAMTLLRRLATGEDLATACEAIAREEPAIEAKVGPWFQQWSHLGWIARVVF